MPSEFDAQTEPLIPAENTSSAWGLVHHIGFRFVFLYFGLYMFPFPLYYIPYTDWILGKYEKLLQVIEIGIGQHVIHHPVIFQRTGSGDTAAAWVQVLFFLFVAFVGTVIWSALDRKRPNYVTLNNWFLLILRLWLATTLISYGATKFIPTQMPAPGLSTLLERFGDFSPMGLLWTFTGASKPYEIIVGSAELVAGFLLIFPRTASFGACIAIVDMLQVFILNMCYDVPVKQYSFHLMISGIILLAPELHALANFFFLKREATPYVPPPFFRRWWPNCAVLVLQIALGIYITTQDIRQSIGYYKQEQTRPPLGGIWSVDEFSADGQVRPPLINDDFRWQRVIFEYPNYMEIQSMDGKIQGYRLQLDLPNKKATLKKRDDPNWIANLEVVQSSPEILELKGQFDSHLIDAKSTRFDEQKFLLHSRGFHWITEQSFNR